MADIGSRRGAANIGFPLMLLTFLLLGGFMYWLYVTAEPTQPAVVEEVEEPEDTFAGTTVPAEELKTGAQMYEGQSVRLAGVEVSSTMGAQAFFVDLPASESLPATPFLIRALPDAGPRAAMGSSVTVSGILMPMTDSIVTDWVGAGIISENDRLLVEFASHFIEADQVQTTEAAGSGASAGS